MIKYKYFCKIINQRYHEELLVTDFPNFLEKRKNLTGK